MPSEIFLAGVALLAMLVLNARVIASESAADARLIHAAEEPQNGLTHGGTYDELRYSGMDDISTRNIDRLGLAWSLELDTRRGQETTPLAVDGTVYVTTAWSKVVAIDGATGRQLWKFDPEVPGRVAVRGCCDVVNRGAAFYDGKIYVGTFDGRLIALEAGSGRVIWCVATVDVHKPYTITGAPRALKGMIVIGNGGAELGVRGYVTAYDAQTGKLIWRFYTVPNPRGRPDGAASDAVLQRKAAATWFDGAWKQTGGGGTAWDALVYDAELDQLYIGVGNGSPWSHVLRSGGKGDNLFLSSIVAVDAATGAYRWHFQETPGESWDFTASQPIMLRTLTIEGKPRKVLMQAPKSGFFYVIDRTNGKLISAEKFVHVNWATGINSTTGRPMEVAGARYANGPFLMAPSAYGGHSCFPMSFSPKTNLVYLPIQDVPAYYEQDATYRYRLEAFNLGSYSVRNTVPTDLEQLDAARRSVTGALIAWDPIRQREVWRAAQRGPASAGTLATAGNLVFEGNPQGLLEAFDASSGQRLWQFHAQTSVLGSPISYGIGGEQYVVVVSGAGGGYGLSSPFVDNKRAKPNGRVLAFKLGGSDRLPPYLPPPLAPARPPEENFSAAQVARGNQIFDTTCGICHGAAAISGGVIPDLRRSAVLDSEKAWKTVVLDGALTSEGMVGFAKLLSSADAEAVRGYVASRSKILQAQDGLK